VIKVLLVLGLVGTLAFVGFKASHPKWKAHKLLRSLGLHAHHGPHRRHGPRHGVDGGHEHSKCHACLAAGEDFCISGNKCIPRATFQCKGPHDHITGDKDFALHGNPDGVQHSMVCPQPEQKLDCYFDKECHAKVDWEKISEIKGGFFARLKVYKERGDVAAVKDMMSKVHEMFRKAGMPEDRIDYILVKWVKYVYPEAIGVDGAKARPSSKMCEKAKTRCMDGDAKVFKGRCGEVWKACGEDVAALAKSDKKNRAVEKTDPKDCYFDAECHAKVDWKQIAKMKRGFFVRLKLFKAKGDTPAVKEMMAKVHEKFQEAGVPDDRIDYIIDKWVKSVYPEALQDFVASIVQDFVASVVV